MIAKKLLNNIQKRGVYVVGQYTAVSPVQIVNNTISLETSFIDKANSVDRLQRSIDRNTTNITTNTNSINSINNSINGISTQLTTLNNSINTTNNNVSTNTQNIQTNTNNIATNTQQIEAVKTKAETNESRIDTLNTNVATKLDTATYNQEKTNFAKTNEANTFTAENTFNANLRVENGNTAGIYASKDITNDNDNQIVNYKAFYWKEIHSQNSISIEANTVSAYEFTTNQLVARKDIRVMLRFAATSYDYTLAFELVCNSLSYKNQGEVKILHWGNNTVSTLDPTKFVFVTVAQYSNNKLRINIKNATDATIQTGTIKTYIQALKPNFQR